MAFSSSSNEDGTLVLVYDAEHLHDELGGLADPSPDSDDSDDSDDIDDSDDSDSSSSDERDSSNEGSFILGFLAGAFGGLILLLLVFRRAKPQTRLGLYCGIAAQVLLLVGAR